MEDITKLKILQVLNEEFIYIKSKIVKDIKFKDVCLYRDFYLYSNDLTKSFLKKVTISNMKIYSKSARW